MNLAISTILVFFLFVIPGVIFRRFYFTNEFSRQYFKSIPFQVIFVSIIPGIIGQAVFSFSINNINWIDKKIQFENVFKLLLGIENSESKADFTDLMTNNIYEIFFYNICLWLLMGFSGFIGRAIIRRTKFDRKYSVFRFQNEWHYILRAEIYDYPQLKKKNKGLNKNLKLFWTEIDVLVSNGDFHYLYHGILDDYVLDGSHSGIDRIYLSNTHRWTIDSSGKKDESSIHKIAGDFFVIPYTQVKNLNITYIRSKPPKNYLSVETKKTIYSVFWLFTIILIWSYSSFVNIPIIDSQEDRVWIKILLSLISVFVFESILDKVLLNQYKRNPEIYTGDIIEKKKNEIGINLAFIIVMFLILLLVFIF